MAKQKPKQPSYISVLFKIIPLHHFLLFKPRKYFPVQIIQFPTNPKLLVLLLFLFLVLTLHLGIRLPFSPVLCAPSTSSQQSTNQWQGGNVLGDNISNVFWKQPSVMGYRPCLNFSEEYQLETVVMAANKRKYLLVVVSGGLNQQKIEIVDAVVIARILGAVLVMPILQVNAIWGDERCLQTDKYSSFLILFFLKNIEP
jgi:GDP-fucose protein O-fucosyltransferase